VASLLLGNHGKVVLPGIREELRRTLLIEPVNLAVAERENAAQHELGHAFRVGLRVGKGERGPPGAAKYLPAVNAEVLAQPLDVCDEVPRRVRGEIRLGIARVREAAPAAALVEQHDPVSRRIKESPMLGVYTPAGPAVQEHDGLAVGTAALLPEDLLSVPHWEPPEGVRLDRRVQGAALTHTLSLDAAFFRARSSFSWIG